MANPLLSESVVVFSLPRTVITNASIQFKAYKSDSNTDNLTIQGEAADNPVTFSDNDYDISSRAHTVASVPWSPGAKHNNGFRPERMGHGANYFTGTKAFMS